MCSEALLNHTVFEFLFSQLKNPVERIAWHSAWVLEKASEADLEIFTNPQKLQLIELTAANRHSGLQHLVLSILLNIPLPQPFPVDFINRCLEQMASPKETVGVQVLSMKILEKICLAEPGLIPELISILENIDDKLFSKGFAVAKKNIVKRLSMRP